MELIIFVKQLLAVILAMFVPATATTIGAQEAKHVDVSAKTSYQEIVDESAVKRNLWEAPETTPYGTERFGVIDDEEEEVEGYDYEAPDFEVDA